MSLLHSTSASAAFLGSKPMPTSCSTPVPAPALAPALARFLQEGTDAESGGAWEAARPWLRTLVLHRQQPHPSTWEHGCALAPGRRTGVRVRAAFHIWHVRMTHRSSGGAWGGGEKRVKTLVQRSQESATLAVGQPIQRCRHQRQLHGCLGLLALRAVATSLRLPLKRRRLRSFDGRGQHDGVYVLLRQPVPANAACVSAMHSTRKPVSACTLLLVFAPHLLQYRFVGGA